MPLKVNLRHLEDHPVQLQGELSLEELDIDTLDEVIQTFEPLKYEVEVERVENGLLVSGRLSMNLLCECVRCLTRFVCPVELPDWTAHIPLEGEDAAPVVNDMIDLTPVVREDILLDFPQHPLCNPNCGGLPDTRNGNAPGQAGTGQLESGSPAWAELNKLKLRK